MARITGYPTGFGESGIKKQFFTQLHFTAIQSLWHGYRRYGLLSTGETGKSQQKYKTAYQVLFHLRLDCPLISTWYSNTIRPVN